LGLCHFLSAFDRYVVDGIVNLVGIGNFALGETLRLLQTGKAQTALGGMAIATVFFGAVLVVGSGNAWAWIAATIALVALGLISFFDRMAARN
jgi:hypothetical protein